MMALNRYRLRNFVKKQHTGAIKASQLLEQPDRLISVILIGNNFVNILASAIATIIAVKLWGDAGIAIATALLTLVILVFAEVTPKTIAAFHPETIAFRTSHILKPLLKILYPIVFLINIITNNLLKLLGIKIGHTGDHHLSKEELITLVNEAGGLLPKKHRSMLLGVLELEAVSVDDIMIPRSEVEGIDLNDSIEDILINLTHTKHTRLPMYYSDINQITGILHMRNLSQLLQTGQVSKEALMNIAHTPYFIPESTPLQTQLLNFQKESKRIAVVVDEYGDVQGIVTLGDILEEIVGELSEANNDLVEDIHAQDDGSYFIDGGAYVRDINRALGWQLPTDGPKTINGLITETLESLPDANMCLRINQYQIETLQIQDKFIQTVRILNIHEFSP